MNRSYSTIRFDTEAILSFFYILTSVAFCFAFNPFENTFFRITFSTPLTVRYILTAGVAFLLLMSFSTFSISIYQTIIFNCMFAFIWLIPWLLLHLSIFLGLTIFNFKLFWFKSIDLRKPVGNIMMFFVFKWLYEIFAAISTFQPEFTYVYINRTNWNEVFTMQIIDIYLNKYYVSFFRWNDWILPTQTFWWWTWLVDWKNSIG